MAESIDYNKIMADRHLFNQTVYTPMSQALKLLDERRNNPELIAKVENLLKGDVPLFLKDKKCGILSRHIATPNHESRRFISIAKENELHPVFFEYHDDKFTSNNTFKHSLGQIHLHKKEDKNGDSFAEKITIVDFNKHNGERLKDVKTLWQESLVNFHRKLFEANGYKPDEIELYNASEWFHNNGGRAIDYYTNFLLLFTCFGVLFENFLISDEIESCFTRDVVLPALQKVFDLSGLKPLIVPLEPLDLETEDFWLHHHEKISSVIPK